MMPELTDAELAEIETRAEAATPGPWTASIAAAEGSEETHEDYLRRSLYNKDLPLWVTWAPNDTSDGFAYVVPAVTGDGPTSGANADFIAAARTDVPRLVAALRAAREYLAAARAEYAAVSSVLQAALGERFAPDGPLADQVRMLAGERDQARRQLADAQLGGYRPEYGAFQDRTSDGLGHAFIATRIDREAIEEIVANLAATEPNYPAYAKKRLVRCGPWEPLAEEGADRAA